MDEVVLTVDLEPDCPPYLEGWRGMHDGAPRLLDLLAAEGVPATFFTTSRAAERCRDVVERLVDDGHELGCHGRDHVPFPGLSCAEARDEIEESAAVLRGFAPVVSFRAPYLDFPEAYLPFLEAAGFRVDASRSRYKPAHWLSPRASSSLHRLDASASSSWLRIPAALRDPWLGRLKSPVVLFVHPWELVDMSGQPVPWDCRWGTGRRAVEALREVIGLFRRRGARFVTAAECAAEAP